MENHALTSANFLYSKGTVFEGFRTIFIVPILIHRFHISCEWNIERYLKQQFSNYLCNWIRNTICSHTSRGLFSSLETVGPRERPDGLYVDTEFELRGAQARFSMLILKWHVVLFSSIREASAKSAVKTKV